MYEVAYVVERHENHDAAAEGVDCNHPRCRGIASGALAAIEVRSKFVNALHVPVPPGTLARVEAGPVTYWRRFARRPR